MKLIILLTLVFTCQIAYSAYCNGKPKEYFQNHEAIWTGNHRFISRHPYGKLFQIGTETTTMKLLHVYGTMYQMGLAQGSLLKQQLKAFIGQLWNYIQDQITDGLPKKVPAFLKKDLANMAIGKALDLNYLITKPYTNRKYY